MGLVQAPTEQQAQGKRPKRWSKQPGKALGEYLDAKARQERLDGQAVVANLTLL